MAIWQYSHMKKPTAYYEKRALIAKAIGHPTRLLMIDVLAEGECCVCELNKLVAVDQSTLSKHLAVLKNAGIIIDTKKGLNVYYRLKCNCVLSFFECATGVLLGK